MPEIKQNLGPIAVTKQTGQETFRKNGISQGITLIDFWSWSTSDLVLNITRGVVAEFIVAKALNAKETVRIEWAPYDITTPEGVAVEVKSAAYFQSWEQTKLSTIQFNVEKKTPLDNKNGGYQGESRRAADVYVFALLAEKEDKSKVDPLNLDQWKFYVVPKQALEIRKRSQQSITLHSLINERDELKMEEADFSKLKDAVNNAAAENKSFK